MNKRNSKSGNLLGNFWRGKGRDCLVTWLLCRIDSEDAACRRNVKTKAKQRATERRNDCVWKKYLWSKYAEIFFSSYKANLPLRSSTSGRITAADLPLDHILETPALRKTFLLFAEVL